MHTQTVEAAAWWARTRGEKSATWIGRYKNSLKARHRDVIAGVIGDLSAMSVLEVGCHCGPNLVRLANQHPTIETLLGIDVNEDAITEGRNWVASQGLSTRIHLKPGRVPEATQDLSDGCVDVVLSCYALAYISPPDLDGVLWEIGRLARKAIVIAEPMTDEITVTSTCTLEGYQEWAHNYRRASRWIGTWQGMTFGSADVVPPVDHLEHVLVAVRGSESLP